MNTIVTIPHISTHTDIPEGYTYLGRWSDDLTFLRYLNSHLVIVEHSKPNSDRAYFCTQYEFPLETIEWFTSAIELLMRPPNEGGLPPGVLVHRTEFYSEKILLQRAFGLTSESVAGFILENLSRESILFTGPQSFEVTDSSLFDDGFLEFWKGLS